jgi:hypothetical protein
MNNRSSECLLLVIGTWSKATKSTHSRNQYTEFPLECLSTRRIFHCHSPPLPLFTPCRPLPGTREAHVTGNVDFIGNNLDVAETFLLAGLQSPGWVQTRGCRAWLECPQRIHPGSAMERKRKLNCQVIYGSDLAG